MAGCALTLAVAVDRDDVELVVEPHVDLGAVGLDDLDLVGRSLLAIPLELVRLARNGGHGGLAGALGLGSRDRAAALVVAVVGRVTARCRPGEGCATECKRRDRDEPGEQLRESVAHATDRRYRR